jgi:two-component system alkaline phosphatase synthesis response regulator PhoP
LIEDIWGAESFPTNRTVDNYIVKLRKWCESDPSAPLRIVSVRGVGYRLD